MIDNGIRCSEYGRVHREAFMKAALVFGMVMVLAAPALAQDKTAIEKLNERFSAAFVKGDIATVAEMYAEDAFLLPAGLLWCGAEALSSHSGKKRARVSTT